MARKGEVVGEFAIQRRVVIPYEAISPKLHDAILAAEDDEFERHFGLSIPRIAMALMKDIVERRKAGGASTLTQQLARKLFLTDEKTWERKIKEALLAIQIEKRYTKREIFTLYCNQMYLGHGAYGVEAASRLYFNKSAKDLTLEEAALIAGIIQGNVRQSPYVNMDAALRRRNYTLGRMAEEGYISQAEADAARKKPIVLRGAAHGTGLGGPVLRRGGAQGPGDALRREAALRERAGDPDGARRRRCRRPPTAPSTRACAASTSGAASARRSATSWPKGTTSSPSVTPAGSGRSRSATSCRRSSPPPTAAPSSCAREHSKITVDRKGFQWTGKTAGTQLVTRGDLVEARVLALDPAAGTATASLEQPPLVEGAVLAIDNRTGQVMAMVGGYSFERSKFNRATQALPPARLRPSSPIVYTAAIDRGYTPVVDPDGHAGHLPGRGRIAALHAGQLRPQVRGADHAAPRARAVAQRAGGAR